VNTACEDAPFSHTHAIEHALAPDYPTLRRLPNRRALIAHPRYPRWKREIDRVMTNVEHGVHADPRPPSAERLRVAAWNIRRGAQFEALVDALTGNEDLRDADVLLLTEVDHGMARSGYRHVARDLAAALRMHYAFGASYVVLGDDFLENEDGHENELALAGNAILSRYPLVWTENVDLPELKDKFSSRREKRLGKKRGIMAGIELPSGSLTLAGCHLDSNASPRQRADQVDFLLRRAEDRGRRVLLGGDFNTTTYDASGFGALMRDLGHKAVHHGFDGTLRGYMTPDATYEAPLFEVLARHGLHTEGFNDRSEGTFVYDMRDPYAIAKLYHRVGRVLTWALKRRLRPFGGICAAKLDWFAGRGIEPLDARVVPIPHDEGPPPSDHRAIAVDIAVDIGVDVAR